MKEQGTSYFTYESYMRTKGLPYVNLPNGDKHYFIIKEVTDKHIIIKDFENKDICIFKNEYDTEPKYNISDAEGRGGFLLIESSDLIGGTLKVEPTETYSDKVKRVKKDAIDRIRECIEVELDYVAKELDIDVDSICLNIDSTQDVMRFEDGHTETQTIRTIAMDIQL